MLLTISLTGSLILFVVFVVFSIVALVVLHLYCPEGDEYTNEELFIWWNTCTGDVPTFPIIPPIVPTPRPRPPIVKPGLPPRPMPGVNGTKGRASDGTRLYWWEDDGFWHTEKPKPYPRKRKK